MFNFFNSKPKEQTQKPSISFDVKQSKDQRPAYFAIQETNKDGKHVSWHISPHQDTNTSTR